MPAGTESAVTKVGLGETVRELTLDAIETLNATPFLAAAKTHALCRSSHTAGPASSRQLTGGERKSGASSPRV